MTDEQLLARFAAELAAQRPAGAERALVELIQRYEARVLGFVRGKLPYEARAEEIAADVIEAAIRAIQDGRDIGAFRAWIFRVARNHVADFWRSAEGQQIKKDRAAAGDDQEWVNDPAEGVTTDEQDRFELEDLIASILAGMKDSHRRIVELYVLGDLDANEVAERTGESQANVYKVKQRFKDELRRRLQNPATDTWTSNP